MDHALDHLRRLGGEIAGIADTRVVHQHIYVRRDGADRLPQRLARERLRKIHGDDVSRIGVHPAQIVGQLLQTLFPARDQYQVVAARREQGRELHAYPAGCACDDRRLPVHIDLPGNHICRNRCA